MRASKLFRVTLLVAIALFMIEAHPGVAETEKENITFALPKSWTPGEKGPRGELNFSTSNVPGKGLAGYIRSFYAPPQTAWEWAIEEAKQLEAQGWHIVTQPTERQAGDSTWATLVWEQSMPVGGAMLLMRGEQYYLKGKQTMIEIVLAGPKDLFERVDRREIDVVLSSAGFDARSREEVERAAEVEAISGGGVPGAEGTR